ncbi:MAG: redoxin domain-containing protein [Verrucomicrobiales bacterium]
MLRKKSILAIALTASAWALLCSPGETFAEESGPTSVENFALLDHEGKFHELDYYCRMPSAKGVVLFIQGNGCPLVQKRIPELKRLKEEFEGKGILFAMLNANIQDERAEIAAEAKEFGINMPILKDDAQLVAERLGVTRTAEALLIDSKSKEVVYRGAIDDRMTYQKEKPEAGNLYLRDAIEALIAGEQIAVRTSDSPGCKVALPEKDQLITYVDHVAPILKSRCVACHTQGGLGPFAMSSYKKVKGWSDMIAEVLMTRQMPPWHADPEYGKFANDCGISPEETRTLVSWVDAGCPKGEGEDILVGYNPPAPKWHLGEPQKVIALPEQVIEAEGVFDYRYVTLDNPFDGDVWLTATEIRPGNTRVVHHVIVTAVHPEVNRLEKWVTGYAPGTEGSLYPEGSAVMVPKGWKFKFQLHYTASGKHETDVTTLGLHFTTTPVEKEFKTKIVMTRDFKIPPGAYEYGTEKDFTVKSDTTVYALNPHMHYRGKRMSFEAEYPDGRKEVLLSVPNYNFNWQRTYHPATPLEIPSGTKIVVRNAWDNSDLNPHNPDPNREVGWGDQTFEEMFFATIGYIEKN